MNHTNIKKLLNSGTGAELKEFLIQEATKLNSIDNIKDIDDPTEIAIEIKAQKKALKMIRNIYSQILNWEEAKQDVEIEKYYS